MARTEARVKGGATIDEYIANQPAMNQPSLRVLRKLVNDTAPGLNEKIMWGQPVFLKGREKVAFLYAAGDHVNFGFFRATELKDPKSKLDGTGKGMRHIKVWKVAEIDTDYFASLVKQAVALKPK